MNTRERYSCAEAMRRLDDYLDRELAPDESARVEEHLQTCARCLRRYNFERAVLLELRAKLRRVAVPPSLKARVLLRARFERGSPRCR